MSDIRGVRGTPHACPEARSQAQFWSLQVACKGIPKRSGLLSEPAQEISATPSRLLLSQDSLVVQEPHRETIGDQQEADRCLCDQHLILHDSAHKHAIRQYSDRSQTRKD